mgnify:CR=1 FL=1
MVPIEINKVEKRFNNKLENDNTSLENETVVPALPKRLLNHNHNQDTESFSNYSINAEETMQISNQGRSPI